MSTSSQQLAASTSTTAPARASGATSSNTLPPVTLPPTTHLDPGAYIRGTHPIDLGENNLIHPRALLTSTTHPLIIGNNNTISERAVLGGAPYSSSGNNNNNNNSSTASASSITSPSLSNSSTPKLAPPSPTSSTAYTTPTTLHSNIHILPGAQISHSATIHSFTTIDSHAVVYPGVTVGSHSKICAGVHVRGDVPEWTVVFGDGGLRRSRKPGLTVAARLETPAYRLKDDPGERGANHDLDDNRDIDENGVQSTWQLQANEWIEDAEAQRVKGVDREREAAMILLRNAARAAVAAKRASVQR